MLATLSDHKETRVKKRREEEGEEEEEEGVWASSNHKAADQRADPQLRSRPLTRGSNKDGETDTVAPQEARVIQDQALKWSLIPTT